MTKFSTSRASTSGTVATSRLRARDSASPPRFRETREGRAFYRRLHKAKAIVKINKESLSAGIAASNLELVLDNFRARDADWKAKAFDMFMATTRKSK